MESAYRDPLLVLAVYLYSSRRRSVFEAHFSESPLSPPTPWFGGTARLVLCPLMRRLLCPENGPRYYSRIWRLEVEPVVRKMDGRMEKERDVVGPCLNTPLCSFETPHEFHS